MKTLAYQIATLLAQAEDRRESFLEGHFRNCRFALEFCATQLQLGHLDTASREVHVTEKEVLTILRFLPNVKDDAQRRKFSSELDRILIRLHGLRVRVFDRHPTA